MLWSSCCGAENHNRPTLSVAHILERTSLATKISCQLSLHTASTCTFVLSDVQRTCTDVPSDPACCTTMFLARVRRAVSLQRVGKEMHFQGCLVDVENTSERGKNSALECWTRTDFRIRVPSRECLWTNTWIVHCRADGFPQRQQPIMHRDSRERRRHSPRLETDIRPAAYQQCSGGAQENKVTKVSEAQAVSTRIRRTPAGDS